jgi:hypothetical protein
MIRTLILPRASTTKDLSLTDRVPNTDTAATVVKVAMLSMTLQNKSRQCILHVNVFF